MWTLIFDHIVQFSSLVAQVVPCQVMMGMFTEPDFSVALISAFLMVRYGLFVVGFNESHPFSPSFFRNSSINLSAVMGTIHSLSPLPVTNIIPQPNSMLKNECGQNKNKKGIQIIPCIP